MATAFELSHPRHEGRFEITVYQMGFRLGGKGASGRGANDRIEEHGLHLWMGFYENAFRMMRACYDELGRDPQSCSIARLEDAFVPAPDVGVTERSAAGRFRPWIAHFPAGHGMPGDPLSEENPFTVRGYLVRAAQLVVELLRVARTDGAAHDDRDSDDNDDEHGLGFGSGFPPMHGPGASGTSTPDEHGVRSALSSIERLLAYGKLATTAALLEAAELLRLALQTIFPHLARPRGPVEVLLRLVEAIASAAERQIGDLVGASDDLRRAWEIVDLVLAVIRGCLRFGLAFHPKGFDAIDDYDWREWLKLNGASEGSLDSAFMRGIYDLMFAYEDGDVARPRFAAGVALRGALRMFFTYRGALFFRMGSGMGDVVFAPLYELLARRGVTFRFFHRLRDVGLAEERKEGSAAGELPSIATLTFDIQAEVKGKGLYAPLVDVGGLPCWPSRPSFAQLEDGERLEREGRDFESQAEARVAGAVTLHVTEDFDLVVLGVGLGAIPHVAPALVARSPAWRAMVTNVKTVATQSFQVWMTVEMRDLGWNNAPANVSGFVEPFDTWADMTHLLPTESWRGRARSIAYFCSVLPEARPLTAPPSKEEAEARRAEVRDNAVRFLNHDIGWLWPKAPRQKGEFRWEVLAGPSSRVKGEARFDTQYFRANVEPTERYTLSLPGTTQHRVSPLDLHFDNLTVVGDFTASGLNSGCVESAVMSGLLGAHALSRSPRLEEIIGYDHP